MESPHCTVTIYDDSKVMGSPRNADGNWVITIQTCPNCHNVILFLYRIIGNAGVNLPLGTQKEFQYFVHPKAISRKLVPSEVPPEFSEDYREACLVLADSPKASAALGRRCLQNLLRNKVGIKQPDLAKEIADAIANKHFPSYIAEQLDLIRIVGNFAAHPMKSTSTGEIVPIEPTKPISLSMLWNNCSIFFLWPRTEPII